MQVADGTIEVGHGVDAALVEDEGVSATVCVGGRVVDHGLVVVGHGHILVGEVPAWGFYSGLGGGGGSVGVEVVGIGQVADAERAGGSVAREGQVVYVVAAVVASIAGGKHIAEGDVVA